MKFSSIFVNFFLCNLILVFVISILYGFFFPEKLSNVPLTFLILCVYSSIISLVGSAILNIALNSFWATKILFYIGVALLTLFLGMLFLIGGNKCEGEGLGCLAFAYAYIVDFTGLFLSSGIVYVPLKYFLKIKKF